jgi:hypothetical protein
LASSIAARVPTDDHDIIVPRLHDLDASHGTGPLVFHDSQYHGLTAGCLARRPARPLISQ